MPEWRWSLWVVLKFLLFRSLEVLSGILNQNSADSTCTVLSVPEGCSDRCPGPEKGYIWIFVSTIGELNAINPFIRDMLKLMGETGLVLLTDHEQYTHAYQQQYPGAHIVHHGDSALGISDLLHQYPPAIFLIAEIPCIYSDAPCRFSFRVIYEVKKRSIPIFLVNGWLYDENIACRMDQIEYALFSDAYLQGIDLFLVQTASVAKTLVGKGVPTNKIHVTGNIKFDALAIEPDWDIERSVSPGVLASIQKSGRPSIVAGCVAEIEEAILILDAYRLVRREVDSCLLVLAPRHPENGALMERLSRHLSEMGFNYINKSELTSELLEDTEVIVLDTIGELRDFYAISTVSYVGMNHNILEPLMYNKNVVILPGWEKQYPTYPVYEKLTEMQAITEVPGTDATLLSDAIMRNIKSENSPEAARAKDQLCGQLVGATKKDLELIGRHLRGSRIIVQRACD